MFRKIFFPLLLIGSLQLSYAQVKPKDKNPAVKDTARMYKKIEAYSQKRGFTKFLHKLIFEPVQVKKKIAKSRKKLVKRDFAPFEGKIVRHINVVTLDPFGYSEKDSTARPKKYLSRLGNRIHLKSKALTIKNLIVFRKNKPLDSLRIKESERLIRTQRFVRGVVITPKLISKDSDSVDVEIRELDSWSLIPEASGSASRAVFELTERNFLGLGHQVENRFEQNFNEAGHHAYGGRYTVPNIMNTYIKTSVAYDIDVNRNYLKSVNIERPFFSPFTRWAAGAYFDERFRSDTLPDAQNVYGRQNFKYYSQDYWAGHSFRIFKGRSEDDRTTNLINTVRYLNVNYIESPTAVYDSIDFYSDEKFYMTSVGISSRQFVEEKYLFNYGIIEDVPVGRAFTLTLGRQDKNDIVRPYIGGRVSLGKFYRWGYLSSNFEYGTFFRHSTGEQSAISIGSSYFTNLQEFGRWKLRQFIKAKLVLGNNRQPSRGDELTINDRNGIPGFNPPELYGTKKFVLTFQTQGYSPWNLYGFRLNPYLSCTMAFLGNSETGFQKSRAYAQLGAGLIITNDYLVFSSFQLSLAYYPNIPGTGSDIFKTNAFSSNDFGLMDFDIAKPRTVDYQ